MLDPQKIIELISKGETDKAIIQLIDFFQNSESKTERHDEILLVRAKYHEVISQYTKGVISLEDKSTEVNKINESILFIVNKHLATLKEKEEKPSLIDRFLGLLKILNAKVVLISGTIALITGIGLNLKKISEFVGWVSNDIELIDVIVEEGKIIQGGKIEETELPRIIDIKLVNRTEKVVYFKRVEFIIEKTWYTYPDLISKGVVSPSATYGVEIPFKESPYTEIVNISNALNGNEVDRIQFEIKRDMGASYFVQLKVKLFYNKGDSFIETPKLMIDLDKPDSFYSEWWTESELYEVLNKNVDSLEPREYRILKNSTFFKDLHDFEGILSNKSKRVLTNFNMNK